MAGTEKLHEVGTTDVSTIGIINEAIQYKQEELKRLQHETILEQSIKAGVSREIAQLKTEAKIEATRLKAEAHAELTAAQQAVIAVQKSNEYRSMEVEGRARAVTELEALAEPLRLLQATLSNERIAIEQQRIRNEELLREHDRLADEHANLQAEVAQRLAAVVIQETAGRARAGELDQLAASLKTQEAAIAVQSENLTALKTTIDPKLREVAKLSEQSASDLAQTRLLHEATATAQAELDKQRTDLATLSNQLQAKSEALLAFDANLTRTASVLAIKIQQAKLKGIELDAPEAQPVTP